VDLSTGAAAAAGAYQPGERDLIRACRHRPIAVVSARPAGGCRPSHHRKGGGHHHHDTAGAGADHRRGRHPCRGPRRGRQRQLRSAPGATSVPTTPAGYAELLGWARRLGPINAWGIEGTGSFGAGLTRFLHRHGQVVVEVNRPDRQARRRRGKSDPLDAEAAARAVQAGEGAIPKAGDGQVEMIRSLRVARATAMKARTQAINALKALVVTAPDELREQLRALSAVRLVQTAAGLEPGPVTTPAAAARLGLRSLARRYQALSAELTILDTELDRLTVTAAPKLLAFVWGRVRLGRGAAGRRRRQP
jgi:Transposase